MHLRISFAAAAVAMALAAQPGAAAPAGAIAAAAVSFPSADSALTTPLNGSLYRAAPSGGKPAPAVVLLHQCPGIDPFVLEWAAWFASQGYTALVVDSIGPRKIKPGTCDPANLTARTRALDALGALAYLRAQPDVDKARIAVVGWAFGGDAALTAATKNLVDASRVADGPFRAAVAFYPPCPARMSAAAFATPALLLLASDATTNPAAPCETAVATLKAAGQPVDSHTYARVKEDFDNPAETVVPMRLGKIEASRSITRFDAKSASDAHERVAAFLAQRMP